jgi:hypothetical protein
MGEGRKKRRERGTVRMIRMLGERLSAIGDDAGKSERSTPDRLREVLDGMVSREPRTREREEHKEALVSSSMRKSSLQRAM